MQCTLQDPKFCGNIELPYFFLILMFLYPLGLFDCWATHPFKQLSKESGRIFELFIGFVKNIFLAPWTVAEVSAKLNNSTKVWAYAIPSMTFFVLFIIMHIAEVSVDGCWAIGKIFLILYNQ